MVSGLGVWNEFKNFVFNFLKDSFSKNDFEKYVPNIVFINSFFGFNILCLSSLSKIFFVGELIIDLTKIFDWVSPLSSISICSKESLSLLSPLSFILLSLTIINLDTSPKISGGNNNSKFLFWFPSKLSLLPEVVILFGKIKF